MKIDLSTDHHLLSGNFSCPVCKKNLNGSIGGAVAPAPGHIAICSYCGAILVIMGAAGVLHYTIMRDEAKRLLQLKHPEVWQQIMVLKKGIDLMVSKKKNKPD